MAQATKIEWAETVWNPVTGCTKKSDGCRNCYAARMAQRLRGRFGYPADKPFRVTIRPDRLLEPMNWRKPRVVLVCSMGDLFHRAVPARFIDSVRHVMALCPQHTFLVLTKRPERAAQIVRSQWWERLPNVGVGTSIENQPTADKRLTELISCEVGFRFVSCEPLLGPVNLGLDSLTSNINGGRMRRDHIAWIIAGGETGPGARWMDPQWVRSIRNQCRRARIPFFFKHWGSKNAPTITGRILDGRTWDEMPARIRKPMK